MFDDLSDLQDRSLDLARRALTGALTFRQVVNLLVTEAFSFAENDARKPVSEQRLPRAEDDPRYGRHLPVPNHKAGIITRIRSLEPASDAKIGEVVHESIVANLLDGKLTMPQAFRTAIIQASVIRRDQIEKLYGRSLAGVTNPYEGITDLTSMNEDRHKAGGNQ